MPVRHISADYGILNPEDLLFLQGILTKSAPPMGPWTTANPPPSRENCWCCSMAARGIGSC